MRFFVQVVRSSCSIEAQDPHRIISSHAAEHDHQVYSSQNTPQNNNHTGIIPA